FLFRGKKYSNRLPPGSLGLPVIGQSLDLLKALKTDKVEEWFHKGIAKNGPIWKANLFGYSTVVVHGPSANKFIYTFDGNVLTTTQPPSISRILGSKNLFELSGHDHKRVRAALVSFLKLDVLKQYVAKIDEEIQYHLQTHWHGKNEIQNSFCVTGIRLDLELSDTVIIRSFGFGLDRFHIRSIGFVFGSFSDTIVCFEFASISSVWKFEFEDERFVWFEVWTFEGVQVTVEIVRK
ncbi:cytochrome P450 716B1-like protein, partial [Tanacetum coccineum]